MDAVREAIRARALAGGFDAVGFGPAALADEVRGRLAHYLAEGRQGEMRWMAERVEQRGDPQSLWPEARSVIMLGVHYKPGPRPPRAGDEGLASAYALGRDYHDVIKKRLKALGRWIADSYKTPLKVFVDTAPVMEKPLAQAAGLGWIGKHSVLVSRRLGSWMFLGAIYLALELPPDPPHRDHCGRCRRCLDSCPTDAFPAPYQLDPRRCISYLTIEHQGPIAEELLVGIGDRIYGCDDCLAVCPWNSFAQRHHEPEFLPRAALNPAKLAALARLDDPGFRALFSGSPIKRIGRDRFVRNVLIAVGNSGVAALRPIAQSLAEDPAPMVAAMARRAVERLAP